MTDQLPLFGAPAPQAWEPPAEISALGARAAGLPLYLGTSSWSFPGWRGLVYPPDFDPARLARDGLTAYAAYPLFRAVGLDRSFYAPLSAGQLADYARQVPGDFRFIVKAHRELTTPPAQLPAAARPPGSSRYLSREHALRAVIEPTIEGLGERAAGLLLQFPPLAARYTREPDRFAAALARFLETLPTGLRCFVELRSPELLVPGYWAALRATGALHCFTVHPAAAPLDEQRRLAGPASVNGPVLVRWNLRRDRRYAEARDEFSPFDRLVAEDPATRLSVIEIVLETLRAGGQACVIVNNKAEGSAPLTVERLLVELLGRLGAEEQGA